MSSAEAFIHYARMSFTDMVQAEVLAEMARQRVSKAELARRLDASHTWASRRFSDGADRVAFNTDELEEITAALGISLQRLLKNVSMALDERIAESAAAEHAGVDLEVVDPGESRTSRRRGSNATKRC